MGWDSFFHAPVERTAFCRHGCQPDLAGCPICEDTPTWDFHATAFYTFWSAIMQWRYVRVAAFAWITLGFSRGWDVAAEPFRPLVTAIVAILAAMALLDSILTTLTLIRNRKHKETTQ